VAAGREGAGNGSGGSACGRQSRRREIGRTNEAWTASDGFCGVRRDRRGAATKAGVWVASAPTTKTGNGESVAEFAVLLMLAASRRLNEALAFTRDSEQVLSPSSSTPAFLITLRTRRVPLPFLRGFRETKLRYFSATTTFSRPAGRRLSTHKMLRSSDRPNSEYAN
jgi:hypothetical protein